MWHVNTTLLIENNNISRRSAIYYHFSDMGKCKRHLRICTLQLDPIPILPVTLVLLLLLLLFPSKRARVTIRWVIQLASTSYIWCRHSDNARLFAIHRTFSKSFVTLPLINVLTISNKSILHFVGFHFNTQLTSTNIYRRTIYSPTLSSCKTVTYQLCDSNTQSN